MEGTDPTRARQLWVDIDRRLTDEAPAVFFHGSNESEFVSERAGNVRTNPVVGPLLSQIWVR